jgi:DNA repair protein RAD16
MDRQKVNRSQLASSKDSASSIANSVDSSDYETPGTSRVVTPAETNESKRSTRLPATRFGNGARALELRGSASAQSSSKRRRVTYADSEDEEDDDDDDDDEDADTKLARRLQEEEYGAEPSSKKPKLQRLAPKKGFLDLHTIQNSDPLDLSDSEDDVPLAKIRRRVAIKSDNDDEISDTPPGSFSSPRGGRRRQAASTSASKLSNIFKLDDDDDSSALASVTATDQSSNFDDDDDESVITSNASLAEDVADLGDGQPEVAPRASRPVRAPVVRRGRRSGERGEWGNNRAQRERAKLVKTHPEIITMWDDLKAKDPIVPVQAEQPTGISRQLKSFQLEGLNWMIRQEQTEFKGGLLGDEMGMGKTIQAVSLIMSDYPAKQPTLVVVPPVALMQWQAEINSYTNDKLKVLIYHISANPRCKLMTVKDLKKFNVIMVSYSGLESMYRKENKGWNRADGIVKEDSILHALNFHRIILDEAHSIKQRTTGVAKACFALNGTHKWCLSGTPVQNRIGEFFSLLRFLEVVPFACYFCKQCNCQELHLAQNEKKMCAHCNHSGFNHVSVFNQEILNPITSGETKLARQVGFDKLRLITDRIMLRRMKRDHTSSMELPPKDVIVHNEFFGEIERDFSQSIMSNTQRKFDTYVAQGVMLNNYANIFGLIMQMRQVANHPDLILRRNAEGGQNVLVCCICDEPAEEAIRSNCKHEFCRQCAKNFVRSFDDAAGEADCPRCHIPLSIDWDQPDIEQDQENVKKSSIINRIKMEDWTSSTKIEMLVYDLYKLRSKKQTHKSIVFSQFTSMLQLVQWRLQKSGFSTVLLDGSMTPAQRQKSIEYFMTNVDVEVFLVSLKAGGVALNLTEASRVFIIDP